MIRSSKSLYPKGGFKKSMKKIARYFYAPICPESFAALNRLQKLFGEIEDCHFEFYDLIRDRIESSFSWFPKEKDLLKTCDRQGEKPFLYGALFIEGEKVKGFPPSPKHLEELLTKHNLPWPGDRYDFPYSSLHITSRQEKKQVCQKSKFVYQPYRKSDIKNVCQLCTMHHPYLSSEDYSSEYWSPYEKSKERFLAENLLQDSLFGIIAYYEKEPAGFIEAFPLELASKMGYPISELSSQGVMITCLSIRCKFSGYGLSRKLISALEEEVKEAGYESIEVLAFSDEDQWQPITLYRKNGYILLRKILTWFLMRKEI